VKKRTVYGGGGIMPDYFVAIDTSAFSNYYRDLINQGIFNQFVLSYMDENRTSLESQFKSFEDFRKNYRISNEMDALIKFAEQEGLPFNDEEWGKSEERVSLLFKAYVARDLWEMSMFYQIYNEADPVFQKAREILVDSRFYVEKL
jgi:carboxyl-terminal processing protease